MRVRIRGEALTGRAIDLRGFGLDPATVVEEMRSDVAGNHSIAVRCPDPGPVHDHVGVISTSTTVSRRVALADAACSRGHTAPQADELAAIRERLDDLDPSTADLSTARKRVADASDVEAELRERVATLQGRVQALRETNDAEQAESDLADATRRLSEVQTERIAAEQALARAREEARATRAIRRERLRLEDRVGNLRREAREFLADRVSDSFEEAREAIPDDANLHESVETALAIARVVDLDAPVVLTSEVSPFESVSETARWLDGSVVRV